MTTQKISITPEELGRVERARAFVHQSRCFMGTIRAFPCAMCPTATGTYLALQVLDESPRDARGARRALHDVVCISGEHCTDDHADRTQTEAAAALRKFRASDAS